MPRCKAAGCGAEIVWAKTPAKKSMPINRGSAGLPEGNLAVRRSGEELVARVLRAGEEPDKTKAEWRGVAHWATCPARQDFKSGWSHDAKGRRWVWRDQDKEIVHWVSDQAIEAGPWSLIREYASTQTGECLPDAAKPTGGES